MEIVFNGSSLLKTDLETTVPLMPFFVAATEFSVHGWLLASKQLPPHGWFFPIQGCIVLGVLSWMGIASF